MRYFHTAVLLVCVGGAALVSAVPITDTGLTAADPGGSAGHGTLSNHRRALDDELAMRDVQYADVHLPREAAERGLAQRDLDGVLDRRFFAAYHRWRAERTKRKAADLRKQAAILDSQANTHAEKAGGTSSTSGSGQHNGGSGNGGGGNGGSGNGGSGNDGGGY